MRNISFITTYPLLLFGGELSVHHRVGRKSLMKLDDRIAFEIAPFSGKSINKNKSRRRRRRGNTEY